MKNTTYYGIQDRKLKNEGHEIWVAITREILKQEQLKTEKLVRGKLDMLFFKTKNTNSQFNLFIKLY